MDHLFVVDLDQSAMVEAYLYASMHQRMMRWGALRHRARVPAGYLAGTPGLILDLDRAEVRGE